MLLARFSIPIAGGKLGVGNTDAVHLGITKADIRIPGEKITRVEGAGGDFEIGGRETEVAVMQALCCSYQI